MGRNSRTWTPGNAPPTAFRRGQSGNPTGRPSLIEDIAVLARSHSAAAVETLVQALKDPRLKVQAAEALLSRGWGRPPQSIAVSADGNLIQLHLTAARALVTTFAEADGQPTIEARAEGEPAFNLLTAPKPVE